jgi:hypothetical protein
LVIINKRLTAGASLAVIPIKKRKGANKKKKKNTDKKAIKAKEPYIKVLAHELLAFTLSYLMLVLLDMSKPSQMMLHKLLLDWCHH